MPTLTLNGRPVDVDIRYELEQFEWTRPTWTDERLLAASPFRYDRTPSFYVYLDDTTSARPAIGAIAAIMTQSMHGVASLSC
ncbi:hypothetical protein S100141_04811 [Bacillus licheniformis]|uniref:hypothetical protein n=1 Tax=Bacillus licheniformis TaxID=1402 RepID=UPI000B57586E|nr:hypothetical protein [Bacillus licheniformis]ARW46031.1 hypothetical protein S100141_04811 [Bacillus licheniformis]